MRDKWTPGITRLSDPSPSRLDGAGPGTRLAPQPGQQAHHSLWEGIGRGTGATMHGMIHIESVMGICKLHRSREHLRVKGSSLHPA